MALILPLAPSQLSSVHSTASRLIAPDLLPTTGQPVKNLSHHLPPKPSIHLPICSPSSQHPATWISIRSLSIHYLCLYSSFHHPSTQPLSMIHPSPLNLLTHGLAIHLFIHLPIILHSFILSVHFIHTFIFIYPSIYHPPSGK